jgi:hypothetical protein
MVYRGRSDTSRDGFKNKTTRPGYHHHEAINLCRHPKDRRENKGLEERGWKMLFSFFNKKNEKFAPGAEKQLFYFYSFVEMLLIFFLFFSQINVGLVFLVYFDPLVDSLVFSPPIFSRSLWPWINDLVRTSFSPLSIHRHQLNNFFFFFFVSLDISPDSCSFVSL